MSSEMVSRVVYFHLHSRHILVRTVTSGVLNVSVVRIFSALQLGQFICYPLLGLHGLTV